MQLKLTPGLTIETAMQGELELMPVVMKITNPSETPSLWLKFLKTQGRRIPISPAAIAQCQRYMRQHGTEALSEDGIVAYTIASNALVECLPEVCNPCQPFEAAAA